MNYLDIEVGFYPTYYNRKTQAKISLEEFYSSKFAENHIIREKNITWLFKTFVDPNTGEEKPAKINPELKDKIISFVHEKNLLTIQEDLQEYIAIHGKDDLATAVKSLLPAVTISALYYEIRDLNKPYSPSNRLCIDIDGCDPLEAIEKAQRLGVCCYIDTSISGQGVFGIVPIADDAQLDQHFAALANDFAGVGLKIDYLADRTRLRGWSRSTNAVYADVPVYTRLADPVEQHRTSGRKKGPGGYNYQSRGATTVHDNPEDCEKVHKIAWHQIGGDISNLHHDLGARYSSRFNRFGVSRQYAIDWIYNKFKNHPVIVADPRYNYERFAHSIGSVYDTYYKQHNIYPLYTHPLLQDKNPDPPADPAPVQLEEAEEPAQPKDTHDTLYVNFAPDKIETIWQIILKNHREGYITLINALTGTGKTTLAYMLAYMLLKLGQRAVYAFPTNLSAEQKATEFSDKTKNPLGLELDVQVYNAYTDPEVIKHLPSFPHVNIPHVRCKEMNYLTADDLFIFDEGHKAIIDDYAGTDENWEAFCESPAIKVILTGTPFDEMYKKSRIRELKIIPLKKPHINFNAITTTKDNKEGFNPEGASELNFHSAVNYINELPNVAEKGTLHLVYLNNCKQLDKIKEMYKDSNLFGVNILYSDDKIKNGKVWKDLNDYSLLPTDPDKINVVVCTSVAYESIGVKNKNLKTICIIGEDWPHNVEQIIGRPRCVDEIEVFWLLPVNGNLPWTWTLNAWLLSTYNEYTQLVQSLDILKKLDRGSTLKMDLKEAVRHVEANVGKYINPDGTYNEFRAIKEFYRDKNKYETHAQKLEYFRAKENYTVINWGVINIEEQTQANDALDKIKQEKEIAEMKAFEMLKKQWLYCMLLLLSSKIAAKLRRNIKDTLTESELKLISSEDFRTWKHEFSMQQNASDCFKVISKAVSYYFYLTKVFRRSDHLLEFVEEHFKSFDKIQKQLGTVLLLYADANTNADIINRSRYQSVIKQTAIDESRRGTAYAGAEIYSIVKKAYTNDKHVPITQTKAVQIFKQLFVTETGWRTNSAGKRQRTYTAVCAKDFDSLAREWQLDLQYFPIHNEREKKHTCTLTKKTNIISESVQNVSDKVQEYQPSELDAWYAKQNKRTFSP